MSQIKFQIIVSGQLVEGVDINTAKNNVAKLFKTDISKVATMFSGQPVTIKKDLDENTTRQYMLALKKAGLISKGRPMPSTRSQTPSATAPKKAPPPPPPLNTTTAKPASPQQSAPEIAAVGAELDQSPQPTAANINTDGLLMGEVGEQLVKAQAIETPDIDTSHFETEDVGAELDRSSPHPEPEIDTAHLIMDELGTNIDKMSPAPEFEVDLSQFSMAEAGETIMTHPEVPTAEIDTSKLKFIDE